MGMKQNVRPLLTSSVTAPISSVQPLFSNEREQFDSSSTGQPTSNVQLIVDALADYAKTTGIDLSKNSFATALEQSNSPEAILQLLEGREKAFKEYRDGNRRLINCLSPAVKVIQAFSGILGGGVEPGERRIPSCGSFNVTSSDSLLASERIVCWD
jgi:hypothetical protein